MFIVTDHSPRGLPNIIVFPKGFTYFAIHSSFVSSVSNCLGSAKLSLVGSIDNEVDNEIKIVLGAESEIEQYRCVVRLGCPAADEGRVHNLPLVRATTNDDNAFVVVGRGRSWSVVAGRTRRRRGRRHWRPCRRRVVVVGLSLGRRRWVVVVVVVSLSLGRRHRRRLPRRHLQN